MTFQPRVPVRLTTWAVAILVWCLIIWAVTAVADTIRFDSGGLIAERADRVRNGAPVEIAGWCASACTMHLANGCVWPDAVLVFHGPNAPPATFDHWSELMARFYPPQIAVWFIREGRFGEWQMTGAEAIRLGAKACN